MVRPHPRSTLTAPPFPYPPLFRSPVGRMAISVIGSRILLAGLKPGAYRRGGSMHIRLWAATRLTDASGASNLSGAPWMVYYARALGAKIGKGRSEEHTSELQSLMRISYAVFCLKKKKITYTN